MRIDLRLKICAWGNTIVVRTQELAYIFEQYTLCFLFRTSQPFFNKMLPKCSVPKWPSGPNLQKLKNRENDSGSNPPFALPSHARRKKEKEALRQRSGAWSSSILLENVCRVPSKALFLTCCMPLMFVVKCFGSSWSWWGKRPTTSLDRFFTIWKESMRNDLLSSTAVGTGSSSPVDRWINENSQKSICCRFTGFLLWIVGSLVKQMPKDSWIVSYKIADLLARCASAEIFQCPGSPNIVILLHVERNLFAWSIEPRRLRLAECAALESTKGLQRRSGCSQVRCFECTYRAVYLDVAEKILDAQMTKSTNTTTVWRIDRPRNHHQLSHWARWLQSNWGGVWWWGKDRWPYTSATWTSRTQKSREKSQHLCEDENHSQ